MSSKKRYTMVMSKSVTVIQGSVWSHRSMTRDRNIVYGNPIAPSEPPKHGHGHGHHHGHNHAEGDGPDGEWDVIHEARTYTRRCKTN